MRYNKKYLASILGLLLFLLASFSCPVSAAKEGYAYDDPDLGYFSAREHNGEEFELGGTRFSIMDEDKDVATAALRYAVQIWSDKSYSKADLLQVDTYEATVTNLPTITGTLKDEPLSYIIDEDYSYMKQSRLTTPKSQELASNTLASSEQYMKYMLPREIKNNADSNYDFTAEEITYAGYPAIITKNYYENGEAYQTGSTEYTMESYGSIFIYVTDLELLPSWYAGDITINDVDLTTEEKYDKIGKCYAVLELNYRYDASVYGDVSKQAFLQARVRELYAEAESDFKESFNKYDKSISFDTKKTMDVRNKSFKPGSHESVDTKADEKSGETSISIPEALAIAIIGGGAAILGAGAGAGNGNDKEEDRRKKSRYKMCLSKDFGDAIRYNAPAVTVYGRIVEITPEGEEIDRPDLTASLEMFSDSNLKVEDTAMTGNYMGALVSAEALSGAQNPDSGVLSIRFSGEGGSFQNNITFRLVGDAYIHFPTRGKELTPTIYMLYGDNGSYELPIELMDFTIPPEKIRLELPGDQPFTTKEEKVDDTHYVIRLQNTSRAETNKVQPQQILMVTVYGENEKESAHDSFIVSMIPEGISLRPFTGCPIDENGSLLVACSLAPEQGEDETEIEKTHFQLVLAVSATDKSGRKRAILVDQDKISYSFGKMNAQIEKLQNLLEGFSYEIDSSEGSRSGIYKICPGRQLPQDDRLDYDVVLPVSCEYENQTYTLDIPLRLLGDKLLTMAEKSEEVKLLIKRIKKYVDEEDRAKIIREFKKDLPKMSAADVRLLSKSLVYASQTELYKANRHLLNAEMLDWLCWGLEWYKWIGDQAISVIISKLSYNYAPFVEAVVMPAKDLLVEHMGIWLSDYVSGADSPSAYIDCEKLEQTGLAMLENTLTNLSEDAKSPKKVGGILAVYLVVKTANHYFYDKNDDGSPVGIYGAITSAFGDLTVQSFKIIIGSKLDKLASNPATTKMFGGYADEFIKNQFPAEIFNNGGKWDFDLLKKHLEEITVLASAKLFTAAREGAEHIAAANEIVITLYEDTKNPEKTVMIAIEPLKLGKAFYDFIFTKMFWMLPFIDSVIEAPDDPPYMMA